MGNLVFYFQAFLPKKKKNCIIHKFKNYRKPQILINNTEIANFSKFLKIISCIVNLNKVIRLKILELN